MINMNKQAVAVLLLFIVLDIITGIIKSVILKDVQSSKMREGLLKKVLEIIVVVIGFSCDILLETTVIGNGVIIFFCSMEGISILENCGEYIPLPDGLKNVLENLKESK